MNIEEFNENEKFVSKMEMLTNMSGIMNNGSTKRVGEEPEFSYKGDNFYIDNSIHPFVSCLIKMHIRNQLFHLYDDL